MTELGTSMAYHEIQAALPAAATPTEAQWSEYLTLASESSLLHGPRKAHSFWKTYRGSAEMRMIAQDLLAISPSATACDSFFSVGAKVVNSAPNACASWRTTRTFHNANKDICNSFRGRVPGGFPRAAGTEAVADDWVEEPVEGGQVFTSVHTSACFIQRVLSEAGLSDSAVSTD